MFAAAVRTADKLTLPFVRRIELEQAQGEGRRLFGRGREVDRAIELIKALRSIDK